MRRSSTYSVSKALPSLRVQHLTHLALGRRHRILEHGVCGDRHHRARPLPWRIVYGDGLPDLDVGHAEVASTGHSSGVGVCVCVWCAGTVHVASVVCGSGGEKWVGGLWCLCRVRRCGVGVCGVEGVGEAVG